MTLARNADLISADRLPHNSLRRGELYLKRQMLRIETAAVTRQHTLYRTAYGDLRATALDLADQLGITALSSNRASVVWRAAFLSSAAPRLRQLAEDVWRDTVRATGAALSGAYYGRLWLLDMATREDVFIHMPILRADTLLYGLTEDVYGDLIQSALGSEWRDQYATELDDLTLQLRRAIGQGMANKEDVSALMRRVATTMGVTIDRRFGSPGSVERAGYRANFNKIQTLTRSVVNTVSTAGARAAYQANSDIVKGYQNITASDELVCPICKALDGKVFDLSSKEQPPWHFNCRCTISPVIVLDALENPQAALRTVFNQWTRQLGMDAALNDFMNP